MIDTRFMKSAVIRARCSPELAPQVSALAHHWDLQPSDIVRLAVQNYLVHSAGQQAPLRRSDPTPEVKVRLGELVDQQYGNPITNGPRKTKR